MEPVDVLAELRAAAAVRRATRAQVADVLADGGRAAPGLADRRREHAEAVDRWVAMLRSAVDAGHPLAEVARAAGVAPSSVLYRVRGRAGATQGDPMSRTVHATRVTLKGECRCPTLCIECGQNEAPRQGRGD